MLKPLLWLVKWLNYIQLVMSEYTAGNDWQSYLFSCNTYITWSGSDSFRTWKYKWSLYESYRQNCSFIQPPSGRIDSNVEKLFWKRLSYYVAVFQEISVQILLKKETQCLIIYNGDNIDVSWSWGNNYCYLIFLNIKITGLSIFNSFRTFKWKCVFKSCNEVGKFILWNYSSFIIYQFSLPW